MLAIICFLFHKDSQIVLAIDLSLELGQLTLSFDPFFLLTLDSQAIGKRDLEGTPSG